MTITHSITLLATGAFAGFAGSLLGLGGGFIMTPVQYILYTDMGLPTDMAIKLAFGTTLLAVLPTTISGVWRHSRLATIWWRPTVIMGSCGLIAAFAGATLATHLPGAILRTAFGVVVLVSSIRMLISRDITIEEEPKDRPWLWVVSSIVIGFIAGILGIGGGIVMVPVLVLVFKLKMHNAVAMSLAVIVFTSTGGALGYITNGLGAPGLPTYSLGYVHLPSWLLLTIGSAGMAQIGAITAHRLPNKQLRYLFSVTLLYLGLRMLGVLDWLG